MEIREKQNRQNRLTVYGTLKNTVPARGGNTGCEWAWMAPQTGDIHANTWTHPQGQPTLDPVRILVFCYSLLPPSKPGPVVTLTRQLEEQQQPGTISPPGVLL